MRWKSQHISGQSARAAGQWAASLLQRQPRASSQLARVGFQQNENTAFFPCKLLELGKGYFWNPTERISNVLDLQKSPNSHFSAVGC